MILNGALRGASSCAECFRYPGSADAGSSSSDDELLELSESGSDLSSGGIAGSLPLTCSLEQCGNVNSSNMAVDDTTTRLRCLLQNRYPFVFCSYPMKVISSDFGASLLGLWSFGMKTYARHPNTLK